MTYSAEAAVQSQAGRDLQMHAEGIQAAVRQLQISTNALSGGLAGAAYKSGMETHDVLHQGTIAQAQILHGHGVHYVNAASVQSQHDADAQRMIAQVAAASGTGIAGTING